jgi:hypothetical protein
MELLLRQALVIHPHRPYRPGCHCEICQKLLEISQHIQGRYDTVHIYSGGYLDITQFGAVYCLEYNRNHPTALTNRFGSNVNYIKIENKIEKEKNFAGVCF